jgi:hypothetical protein
MDTLNLTNTEHEHHRWEDEGGSHVEENTVADLARPALSLEATVAAHNVTGTVGALYNELQALITRLNAYLTKLGA